MRPAALAPLRARHSGQRSRLDASRRRSALRRLTSDLRLRTSRAMGVEDAGRSGVVSPPPISSRGWGGPRACGRRWRAARTSGRWCRCSTKSGSRRRSISSGRSRISSRCPSCSRGCSSRCPRASSGAIAARRCCTSCCASSRAMRPARGGRPMRAGWSCRRRCATCARCARSCSSISSRIRPTAAIDRVTIVIDPTPGRVVQHTLYTRAQPTPEQLSTLLARLGALMGQDRFGAPAAVDTDRPGAFAMTPFATDHAGKKPRRSPRTQRKSFLSVLCELGGFFWHRVCSSPMPPARARARGGRRRPSRARHDRSPRLHRRNRHALRGALADVGGVVGGRKVRSEK